MRESLRLGDVRYLSGAVCAGGGGREVAACARNNACGLCTSAGNAAVHGVGKYKGKAKKTISFYTLKLVM
jgi:hypothetical protein